MATIFPISGKQFLVTAPIDGQIGVLGNTSDENPSGCWSVQFVPDLNFVGSFALIGRAPGFSTADTTVPYVGIPYRGVYLNAVVSDYSVTGAVITGPSLIHVPANGISIGVLINCTAGTCQIISTKMEGATTP